MLDVCPVYLFYHSVNHSINNEHKNVLASYSSYGIAVQLLAMLFYAVATIGIIGILSSTALKAIQCITELRRIEKHMETLAGFMILTVSMWLILKIGLGP